MNLCFSIFSAFIPVSPKSQKRAKFPGVDFLGTALKFRKRKRHLSLLVYILYKKREIMHFHIAVVQRQQRNQRKACCTCIFLVLLNKPIAFLTFSLLPPSSLLRLPIDFGGGRWGTQGEGIDMSTMQKGANL